MAGVWVFGYGSLVSAASVASTIGRTVTPGDGFAPAELRGFGRRWNYGVSAAGVSVEPDGSVRAWTIVALGLVEAQDEVVNGVVVRVSLGELALLDRREQNYDRVDVTHLVTDSGLVDDDVVTYVPRTEPVERCSAAREAGTAAVEQRYWDLVDGAFADLGADHLDRYHATTPRPDVPIVTMRRVPARRLVSRPPNGP
jgi:dephospho-CoA kinase